MGYFKNLAVNGGGGRRGGAARILQIRNETFFDRRPVIAALDAKCVNVMARLGGYLRTTMQRSMKTARASAKELRGQKTTDARGRVVSVDGKGRVVDAHGLFLPKDEARTIKSRLAEQLGEGRASKPGTPPNKHSPPTLMKLTEFGYDKDDKTLVCGPQLITSPTRPLGGKTVPQLHNEGGQAFVRIMGQNVLAEYPARPFVEPARIKGEAKLAHLLETIPLVRVKGR